MSTQQTLSIDEVRELAKKPRKAKDHRDKSHAMPMPKGAPRQHWTTFVRGKRRVRGEMNKTEASYAEHLEGQKMLGVVLWFAFEAVTFRLAKDCRYTPDFLVMLASGLLECHECKGFWADDAKVKIKVAAELFPFAFVSIKKLAKKDGGGWERQEF
jgi:hypothetical protein